MSWVGLPGYDCGLCGLPSCASAARHMEAGRRDVCCPFSSPSIGPPWIARPSGVRVVRPCPSRPSLAEVVVSLSPEGASFRPIDAEAAALTLPALGLRTRTALRGQMVVGEGADLRVNAFITGKVSVRSERGEEAAREALPAILRCLAAAHVCQETGLSELEVAAGWAGPGHPLLCSLPDPYLGLAGLRRRGVPARLALRERPEVEDAVRGMSSLQERDLRSAEGLAVELIVQGDLLGLWLLGVAVEVRRALKNDPSGSNLGPLSDVLAGRSPDLGSLRRRAESKDRSAARPALAALRLVHAPDVSV